MESYTDKLQRKIKEFPPHVKEIVEKVLDISRENEMDFDNMWERKHKMLSATEKILSQFELKKKVPAHIESAINNVRRCESDLGFMGSPSYYADKKTVEEYNKSQLQPSPLIKLHVDTVNLNEPQEIKPALLKAFLLSYQNRKLTPQEEVDRDYIKNAL